MAPRTRQAVREPPAIPVWFMLVDNHFTHTLGNSSCVDMPSDEFVLDLIQEVKAKRWKVLRDVDDVELNLLKVWKLRTPRLTRVK